MTPAESLDFAVSRLLAHWRDETAGLSSLRAIAEHPSLRAIVSMGDDAVPYLLRELARGRGGLVLGHALHMITGAQPVAAADAGRLDTVRAAWIAWAAERGRAPAQWTIAAHQGETAGRADAAVARAFVDLVAGPAEGNAFATAPSPLDVVSRCARPDDAELKRLRGTIADEAVTRARWMYRR